MITVNKEEKRIDISGENYPIVLLLINDTTEHMIPIEDGQGCLTNIQSPLEAVMAYGLTEIAVQ